MLYLLAIIETSRPKQLSVKTGAITVNVGSTVYTVNGLTISIICNATTGVPPFNITWYRNENQVKQSMGIVVSTLNVNNATHNDLFTCEAENGMRFDQQNTTIKFVNNTTEFCLHA